MLKEYEFGLDVIAFIGHERLKKHATFPDLGATLRQAHGVPISDRRVQDLFDVYMALISTDIAEDAARLAKLKAQGKIILAIDAAQPDMSAESLWVFRDTLSEEILLVFSSLSADASLLPPYLRKIKALGVPVTGVVSDGQKIIISAVGEVFPGVPHQLCQLHFLKDFAKSISAADQSLQVELGKHLRELSAFERAAAEQPSAALKEGQTKAPKSVTLTEDPPSPSGGRERTRVRLHPPKTPKEGTLVRNDCEILRAILKNHGRYPLKTPGSKRGRCSKSFWRPSRRGLKRGASSLLLRQLVQHVHVALNVTEASSRDVRFLHGFVRKAAKLLDTKASSKRVARAFDGLLSEIREAIVRYPESARAVILEQMLKTSRHFGSKLFTRYDHPDLPSTDNALEGVFRGTRHHERLITGHKSTARRTVRDGPLLVPALERARGHLPSAEDLSKVPESRWRENLQRIKQAAHASIALVACAQISTLSFRILSSVAANF